jgi:hypothetical protein
MWMKWNFINILDHYDRREMKPKRTAEEEFYATYHRLSVLVLITLKENNFNVISGTY